MIRFNAVCFALIAVVHLQTGISILENNFNTVCQSTECQKLGQFYRENIDELGQPCSDFYDYVCSKWGLHNPRPKQLNFQYLWNIDESLELKALHEMRKLLESNIPSTSKSFERAKYLYKTCTLAPSMERSSPSAVWNIMKKIASFPILTPKDKAISNRPFFWEIDELYIQTAGESAFFQFNPIFGDASKNEIVTDLQLVPSAYGSLFVPPQWLFPLEQKHYKSFLIKVIESMVDHDGQVSLKEMSQDLHDVIQFRTKLNKIIGEYSENEKVEIMTIAKFQGLYSGFAKLQYALDFKWIDVIGAMYQNPKDPRDKLVITEKSKVQVNVNDFSKLAALIGETTKRTLVNHIHLYFAERHVELTPQLKPLLADSITISSRAGHAAVRSTEPRWQTCIQTNTMRAAMGKAYVDSNFLLEEKSKLQHIFEATKKAMENQISQSTWLDSAGKQASKKKLTTMKATIGYPDQYDDVSGQSKRILVQMDPFEYEHLYSLEHNSVSVSAAVLQWPIYSPHRPYVIDYGGVASLFGHELHHAFDSDGINYDAQGKLPLLSTKMFTVYENISKCFKDHYEKYKQSEIGALKLDRAETLVDDISDAMGLKVAYSAYKEMLKKSNGVCPVLPGFEKYGCEKLFFIAFASNFCSAHEPGYYELAAFRRRKNLPKIRVNSAVANMKEFSAAFNCRPDDPLNLKQTCDLWRS